MKEEGVYKISITADNIIHQQRIGDYEDLEILKLAFEVIIRGATKTIKERLTTNNNTNT